MVIFGFLEGSGLEAVVLVIVQLGMEAAGGAEEALLRGAPLALATEMLGASFRGPVPFK